MGLFGVSKKIRNMTPDEQYQEGLKQSLICNYKYAFQIYEPLAQQGHRKAQCDIAGMYDKGHGVKMDKGKALYWYEKSAEQNFTPAQRNCAKMYENGEGTSVDKAKALYWYEKVAEKGESDHMVQCGTMYYQGIGTQKDLDKAVFWLEKAEASGNPKAEELLREIRQSGQVGENQNRLIETVAQEAYEKGDFPKALEMYQKAAEQGNAEAMRNCGLMYHRGEGTEKDMAKAFYWNEKAAQQGHREAQCACGWYYQNGEGTKIDKVKALYWYEKAAEQGNVGAQFSCGKAYLNGDGTACDLAKAKAWLQKAADQTEVLFYHTMAERILRENAAILNPQSEAASSVSKAKTDAELYYEGQIAYDNKEFKRSFQIFLPLAEKGMEQAQFMLYAQYYFGEGVERDLEKAVLWLEKAKENGNETAKKLLPQAQMKLFGQLNEEGGQAMRAGDFDKQKKLMKKAMYYALEAAKQGLPIAVYTCAVTELVLDGNKEGTEMARFKAKQSLQEVAGQTEDLKAQELAKQALREYF
jgi:hypothetical protein